MDAIDAQTAAVKLTNEYKTQVQAAEDLDKITKDLDFNQISTKQLNAARATDTATEALVNQAYAETQGKDAVETYVRFLELQTGATEEQARAQVKAQGEAEATADALQKWADKTAKALNGLQAYSDALKGEDWGKASLDGAVTAMSEFTSEHNALIDINADAQKAVDDFSQSIKDNGTSFDVATEKGRANQEALEGVAKTLDTKLAAAYADSGGDMDTFKEKSKAISDDAVKALMPALKGSGISAEDLATKLGLLPEDIETRYKLAGDEEAKLKLNCSRVRSTACLTTCRRR